MSAQYAAAALDFEAFLAEEGEQITLTKIATAGHDANWNRAETLTATTPLVWCHSFQRREVDGARILASDLRCLLATREGQEHPQEGWRVTRGSRTYQVHAVGPGPAEYGPGVLELHLRLEAQ